MDNYRASNNGISTDQFVTTNIILIKHNLESGKLWLDL